MMLFFSGHVCTRATLRFSITPIDERSWRSTFRFLVPDALVQKMKAHEFCFHAAVASAPLRVFRVGSRLQSRFMSWFAKRLASRLRNSANSFEGSGGRAWILRARAAWILRARERAAPKAWQEAAVKF